MAKTSGKGAGRAPTALVTGGRRGIGRSCAVELAKAGFDVVVADLERDDDAEATLDAIKGCGRDGAFVRGDIADIDDHARLLDEALDNLGALDCLVNNAGVSVLKRGDLLEMTPESYDRCLNINLRGTFFLTQRVARWMVDHPAAQGDPFRSIVTISSANATIVSPNRGEYCMSKTALSMMTKLFAVRLVEDGIGCFEIRPGIIRTGMTAVVADHYTHEIANGISPVRRWGEPEDVGRTVATMATGALPFTVGEAIAVDGGLALRHF